MVSEDAALTSGPVITKRHGFDGFFAVTAKWRDAK